MPAGFERQTKTFLGTTRDVYYRGDGPGVVLMHEIPGITPEVAEAARRIADAGFRVAMADLFGTVDKAFSPAYSMKQIARACISREFHVLARNGASPITKWLRALARDLYDETLAAGVDARGVGCLGMCLTGNFGLALAVDPWVRAPVLSQPSLPFGVSPSHRSALHLSGEDLVTLKRRGQDENLRIMGLRFTEDPLCPAGRFRRLERELGDAFVPIEIDSAKGNPHGVSRTAHSVLALDFLDQDGHPTRQALDRVLAFFGEELR
ncbi:MAG: dienelactone hydrolase family protein [Myxococcota bacterium]